MPAFISFSPFSSSVGTCEFFLNCLYVCFYWQVSNTFYFTFSLDPECLEPGVDRTVRRVLPATEEEARTVLARYEADQIVHELAV